MAVGRIGRRRALVLALGGLIASGVAGSPARAAPIEPRVVTKDLGDKVEVQLSLSLHLGPVNFDDRYLGTVHVPKGGKLERVFNPAGAIVQAILAIHGVILTVTLIAKAGGQTVSRVVKHKI